MKSPAILFYTSDFLTGTNFMTNEEVGCYIRLLCYQHQIGHIKKKDMIKICNSLDKDSSVYDKFILDENGLYYNVRMDEEIDKRLDYSKSRSENRSSKNKKDMINICNSYDKHMENENDNINININNNIIRPKLEEVKSYCEERNNGVDYNKWFNFYESKGWMIGKNKMKDWKASVRTWEQKSNDPNWLNKEIKEEQLSEEEQKILRKELEEFETKST
jgi:uncharacterized protein YdaU (DUF1376 family)